MLHTEYVRFTYLFQEESAHKWEGQRERKLQANCPEGRAQCRAPPYKPETMTWAQTKSGTNQAPSNKVFDYFLQLEMVFRTEIIFQLNKTLLNIDIW